MHSKRLVSLILLLALSLNLVACTKSTGSTALTSASNPSATAAQGSQSVSVSQSEPIENPKVKELYDKGLKLYYERKYPEALKLFEQILALEPNNFKALNAKGASLAFQGKHKEGIALIQKSIQLKPDFVYARFNLGLAYELAGNYDPAIAAYMEAIQLDSKDVWSYFGIASIYGRKGNVEKTVEWLKQAIALDPEVKAVAREEKDFNPVRNDSRFQSLLNSDKTQLAVHLPILYYHSVATEKGNQLRMPPEQFAEQMKYLFDNGYKTITPDQLYNALYNRGYLPAKPVLITFDDGYEDNYSNAYRIMKPYNFVGTLFIVSQFINGKNFLNADQLKEMQAGGWTIGGHTASHVDLSKEKTEKIVSELQSSRATLEAHLGQSVKYFCYPFGGMNSTVIDKVKADGYAMAFTTHKGWVGSGVDPFNVQRVYLYADMGMRDFINRLTNPRY